MNYLAAICYKLFGFNEAWYRGLMLCCISVGLYFTFRLGQLLLNHSLLAALITFAWYLSPILCYYSANFLSDTASLGFIMTAWYFYFRYREEHKKKLLLMFFLFATMASLIKITSLISICVIAIITVIEYFANRVPFFKRLINQPAIQRKGILISIGILLISVIAWYSYSASLINKMTDKIFLVGTNPPQSWSDFAWVWNDIKKLWLPYYYHWSMYIVYLIALLVFIFHFKKINPLLRLITIGLGFGTVCFVYLLFNQYRVHDYYIIALLPLFFFLIITSIQHLLISSAKRKSVQAILCFILLSICCISTWWSRLYLTEKYTPEFLAYNNIEGYMESFGVQPEDKVITLYENSFNIQLYFMNRKGWRIEEGKIKEQRVQDYINRGAKYILINDVSAINNSELKPFLKKETGEFLGVHIYSLH